MKYNGIIQRKLALLDDQVQKIRHHTEGVSFEEFRDSWALRSMSERAVQVAAEIVIDIAERIISIEQAGPVASSAKAIDRLVDLGVLSSPDTKKMGVSPAPRACRTAGGAKARRGKGAKARRARGPGAGLCGAPLSLRPESRPPVNRPPASRPAAQPPPLRSLTRKRGGTAISKAASGVRGKVPGDKNSTAKGVAW